MPTEAPKKASVKPTAVIWISLFVGSLFTLGLYTFLVEKEPNRCAMSYMYEMPQYVNLNVSHSRYSLYAYGEGKLSEAVYKAEFSGIPVLFIPGNAGSFRQVRSLASIALRKSIEESKYKVHFDYFAADFVEEYSALYGGTLNEQAAFVRQSIKTILNLYKGSIKPKSVVLVGHSIGGLIAKALFLDPDFDANTVKIIVTLATPHSAPVVNADPILNRFYDEIDQYWNENDLPVTLVSIGGGVKDVQVRPGLTWSDHANLNIQTTAASSIWVSADHRCIVWCKQLALALNRVLFDLIDSSTKQITDDQSYVQQVFQYHLVQRTAGKRYRENLHPLNGDKLFDKNGDWIEIDQPQYTFESTKKLEQNTFLMMPTALDDLEKLTIDAVNMDNDNWIFGCKKSTKHESKTVCQSSENLSKSSAIIPSNGKRKTLTLDLRPLKDKYSHIVVFIPKSLNFVRVMFDAYLEQERNIDGKLPKWINFWLESRLVKMTRKNALFYNISLLELNEPWQAYEITAFPLDCTKKLPKAGENNSIHFGVMKMANSWANDDTFKLISSNKTTAITARLSRGKPKTEEILKSEVHMYLDPVCRYAISVRPDLSEMFGQIVRFYYPMILPLSISIVLMTLAHQMNIFEKEGQIHACHQIIWSQVSPIASVMPARLLSSGITMVAFLSALRSDFIVLGDRGIDFSILPIMMYFISIGFVLILTISAFMTVIVFGNVLNKLVKRVVNVEGMAQDLVADVAINAIGKFPTVLSVLLLAIGASTCGAVSLSLGTLCHFLKLFKIYKSYLEWLVKKSLGMTNTTKKQEDFDKMHFHLSLGLLWALTTVLNLPSLLAWSHNAVTLGIFIPLSPDHSFVPAVIYCLSIPFTWNDSQPNKQKTHYYLVSFSCQLASVLIVSFGLVSMYRINYIVSFVVVCLSLHQAFAPVDANKTFVTEEAETPKEKSE